MAAMCLPFVWCVQSRRVVTLPQLDVTVVAADGTPVPGATVFVHWWSYPHARLEQTHRLTADAQGRVTTAEATRSESVMPLCMHGVPEHHYTLCAGVAGKGWRAMPLEAKPTAPIRLQLTGDAYDGECEDHDRARFGVGQ
jgi:hypothetical protein